MTNAMALPLLGLRPAPLFSFGWTARLGAILALSVCIILSGCSFASFVAAAEADLPIVIRMISNITNIVAPGVSSALAAGGQLALTALQVACGAPPPGAAKCDATSLVGQYQAASDPAVKTSLLQKINLALQTVQDHLGDMLKIGSGLPTGIAAAITAAVGLAISTVLAVMSLIPPSSNPKALKATIAKVQEPPSPKALKQKFNKAIASEFPGAVIN